MRFDRRQFIQTSLAVLSAGTAAAWPSLGKAASPIAGQSATPTPGGTLTYAVQLLTVPSAVQVYQTRVHNLINSIDLTAGDFSDTWIEPKT